MVRLCRYIKFALNSLQVLLELLNRVVFCHLLNSRFELDAFLLEFVALYCFLDKGYIRSKVIVELCSNLTESAYDFFNKIRIWVLHVKQAQELVDDLSEVFAEGRAPLHFVEHLDGVDVHADEVIAHLVLLCGSQ